MAMDKNYITSVELQSYFVDKTTGAPMSGGYVEFFKDSDRVVGKDVYQKVQNGFDISGNPLYEFVSLGDVVQLSAVGTFMDNTNDDIAVYYYPWDEDGNLELYYVAVFNSDGTPQFTREGWPDSFATDNPDAGDLGGFENQISNPQFAIVNFQTDQTFTINLTGSSTTTVEVAPDWNLVIIHTSTTTVNVLRTAIAGSSNLPTQSPFYLTFTPGASITSMKLVQTLNNNPGIWSAIQAGTGGYVAASIVLGPTTPTTTVTYTPSTGTATQLLSESNASGDYIEYRSTVQLAPSNNPTTATTGYVSIVIGLSAVSASTLSSVQVVGMNGNFQDVAYQQTTVNRQIDHLFNYYKDPLIYKPIPSLLNAWDFPLNVAQFLGPTVAASAIGANKSKYVWDQTIVFQSANSAVGVSRGADGAIVLTAAADTKMAMIQYQPQIQARKILFNKSAVNIVVDTTVAQTCTVSLWYTKDGSLPNIATGTNNSLVLSLDDNGKPATFNGTWVEVPRVNFVDARFTTDGTGGYQTFSFNGWKLNTADINLATFFAIVIGTNTVVSGNAVVFNSVGLCAGDIATIPAPQSAAAVLADCQRYYEKSFALATVPAQNVGVNTGEWIMSQSGADGASQSSGTIPFKVIKNTTPAIITYNPAAANAQIRNETTSQDCNTLSIQTTSTNGFSLRTNLATPTTPGDTLGVHWTADSRLGL